MQARAIVFQAPGDLSVQTLDLRQPGPADVEVEVSFTGISTGTERLLWDGTMPPFPGLAYPLVPGYETVGTVVKAGPEASAVALGDTVFVPGSYSFFGGAEHLWRRRFAAGRAARARGEGRPRPRPQKPCCCRWRPPPTTCSLWAARASPSSTPTSSSVTAPWAACWRGWCWPPARQHRRCGRRRKCAAPAPRPTQSFTLTRTRARTTARSTT